jgi:hypothetical protein
MQRFALYALCATAAALAVWLVLGTLETGDSPDGSEEHQPGHAAVAEPEGPGAASLSLGEAVRPATDPAELDPIAPPDVGRVDLQAGIDEFTRSGIDGASDAGAAQQRATESEHGEGREDTRDAPAPPPVGGGAGAPVVTTFPPPGDPRVLRSLADEPAPSDATPIEPGPEATGNLADPEVQPRILNNFPEGSPSD